LALALSYWIIDVKKMNRWVFPFAVVGMNSIFIYMFSNTVGGQWFNGFVAIFTNGVLNWVGASEFIMKLATSLTILTLEWLLCYYLYLKKIFFRI
jgi:predicted acyltransferase